MTKKDLLHRAIEEATPQEHQEIRSILMFTFQSGVRVRAYAPFLEIGQVRECEAVIYSDLSGEFHSYKGTATVGYDASNAFLARLKDGRETYLSIGIIGACHWNEKDRTDFNEQTIHVNKKRVWRDKEQGR